MWAVRLARLSTMADGLNASGHAYLVGANLAWIQFLPTLSV